MAHNSVVSDLTSLFTGYRCSGCGAREYTEAAAPGLFQGGKDCTCPHPEWAKMGWVETLEATVERLGRINEQNAKRAMAAVERLHAEREEWKQAAGAEAEELDSLSQLYTALKEDYERLREALHRICSVTHQDTDARLSWTFVSFIHSVAREAIEPRALDEGDQG